MSILNSGVNEKMIKTDKVVYRTRTQEEYDWLMEKLEKAGCEWGSGSLPTEINYWVRNFAETCICLNDKRIMHSGFAFFKAESEYKNYEFIEVSDLMETEKEPDAQDKTEEETNTLEEIEAIHKQLTNQIEDLRKQGKEPKAVEYTIKVCFE